MCSRESQLYMRSHEHYWSTFATPPVAVFIGVCDGCGNMELLTDGLDACLCAGCVGAT